MTAETTTGNTVFDLLDRETRNYAGWVRNAVEVRKAHPTYGYTKALLRERLAHLEGMLLARAALNARPLGTPLLAMRDEAEALGIDLDDLRKSVQTA